MASIYLMRHGQASFGAKDYDNLSDIGHRQAQFNGQYLAQQAVLPTRIVSGTLRRQQQTVEGVLKGLGDKAQALPVHTDAGWNEFDHADIIEQYATVEGALADKIAQAEDKEATFRRFFVSAMTRWVESQHDHEYIETWRQFEQRTAQQFEQLSGSLKLGERVLVVTSGGPISLVVRELMNLDSETALHLNWRLVNGGLTKVAVNTHGRHLVSFNEHMHFNGEHRHLLSAR